MHKTHSKTLEMALKGLYFSKFPGEHAAGPLEVLAPLADSCPPPKDFQARTPMFLLGRRSERLSRRLVTPPARMAWRSYKFASLRFSVFFGVTSWATAHE